MWWILAAVAGLFLVGKAKASATPSAQPQTQFLPILGGNARTITENPVNRGSSLNLFGGNPSASPVGGPILLYPKLPPAVDSGAGGAVASSPSGGGGGTPSGGSGSGPTGLTGLGGHRALL